VALYESRTSALKRYRGVRCSLEKDYEGRYEVSRERRARSESGTIVP
jgi:hypothetical protein